MPIFLWAILQTAGVLLGFTWVVLILTRNLEALRDARSAFKDALIFASFVLVLSAIGLYLEMTG